LKKVAILGSTGSIGTQALEVSAKLGTVSVAALSAHRNGALLAEQARAVGARRAALSDPEAARRFAGDFKEMGVKLHAGPQGILELLNAEGYDLVLNAIVGSAGLAPTLEVLGRGTALALANKESLVAGGKLVMDAARRNGVEILPVDSEHSAVFQCLRGEGAAGLKRVILTASGGPFREEPSDLSTVTVEQALAHPTWNMGPKVTIDSATLMNKGLEVLEAHHLFSVGLDSVDVIVHPQSVIHSMVEMVDGSVLAHMGVPDMRIPIQYSLTYPERAECPAKFLSLAECRQLTFTEVDTGRFPCLRVAYEAGRSGGTYPAAMNAANEEAVAAFLAGRIKFNAIGAVVEGVVQTHRPLAGESLEEIVEAENAARAAARRIIEKPEA
jgi:1-deoxy-D-xylulose-5-phosphate reductoisomerase